MESRQRTVFVPMTTDDGARVSHEEYVYGPARAKMRMQNHVAQFLPHLDPTSPREGTNDTPERVARMWVDELCSGYDADISNLFKTFKAEGPDMVVVSQIPLVSTCEHHLVPFIGYAHVGYLPNECVVGLSKIKRVVDAFGRRLQIQERLTQQVADAMMTHLDPNGVMVVVEAEHLCMTIRGVQAPGTKTITSAVRGAFNENKESEKEEFLRLIGRK